MHVNYIILGIGIIFCIAILGITLYNLTLLVGYYEKLTRRILFLNLRMKSLEVSVNKLAEKEFLLNQFKEKVPEAEEIYDGLVKPSLYYDENTGKYSMVAYNRNKAREKRNQNEFEYEFEVESALREGGNK